VNRPPFRRYCTYFDSAYLARGIAMLDSLLRHDPAADVLVLPLDPLCGRVLRHRFAARVRILEPEALYPAEPRLPALRDRRTTWAFYATQKPAFALLALDFDPRPDWLMFVDADTWFFDSPDPLFREIGDASIAVSPHRFPSTLQHLEQFGIYNAGCICWRNDATGRRCLSDWRDDCLNWCDEAPQPDGRFMNQGYLNNWPERYPKVRLIAHPGVNLAPWNIDGHTLSREQGKIAVDGRPIVFYHYHGLLRDAARQWCSFFPHLERQPEFARQWIYRPYLAAVEAEARELKQRFGIEGLGTQRQTAGWIPSVRFERPLSG